jgi:hypothetical protein
MGELGRNGPTIKKTIVTNETANAIDVTRILSMNEKTCFESSVFSASVKEVWSVLTIELTRINEFQRKKTKQNKTKNKTKYKVET